MNWYSMILYLIIHYKLKWSLLILTRPQHRRMTNIVTIDIFFVKISAITRCNENCLWTLSIWNRNRCRIRIFLARSWYVGQFDGCSIFVLSFLLNFYHLWVVIIKKFCQWVMILLLGSPVVDFKLLWGSISKNSGLLATSSSLDFLRYHNLNTLISLL
jgi:hypothetical protein